MRYLFFYIIFLLLLQSCVSTSEYDYPRPIIINCKSASNNLLKSVTTILMQDGYSLTTVNESVGFISGQRIIEKPGSPMIINFNTQISENNVITINIIGEVELYSRKYQYFYDEAHSPEEYSKVFVPTLEKIKNICN